MLFIRHRLDYGDTICHQSNNISFSDKIESIHYKATLVITGAIKGASKEKLYQD